MTDAEIWGVAWAMFAATAGLGLAVAAIAFFRRADVCLSELDVGYNALGPQINR